MAKKQKAKNHLENLEIAFALSQKRLIVWKIESDSRWFLVKALTKREALKEGKKEFGSINYKAIKASSDDVEYFQNLKGQIETV